MTEPTLLHHFLDDAARLHPDRPALTCAGQRLSYRETAWVSRRLGEWLRGLGIGPGDRILVALPSHPAVPALVFAAARAGVVIAIVHEQVRGAVLRHVVTDCAPRLVIADGPDWWDAAASAGAREAGSAELGAAAALRDRARWAERTAAEDDPGDVLAVDPACLIYTSGSTALPKAVVCTHQQMVFAARAIASVLNYQPADVVYVPLPLCFDYGLYQLFLAAIAGAHVWLGGTAGPGLPGELAAAGATVLPAMPVIAAALAPMLARDRGRRPALRLLTSTGAAMPPSVLAELRRLQPGLGVQLMFGLTECKRVAIMPVDEDLNRPGSCGRPLPGTRVLVVNEEGDQVPAGQVGEFVIRGPHVMSGYWHQPELTARRFERREGLFPQLRTGDFGRLDNAGYLYFEGRRDDLYKAHGFRVSCAEVEAAALRLPGVRAAAVLPPAAGRKEAVLFAVADYEPGALLRELRGELEDSKVPARCVRMPELPVNGNGKVDKRALASYLEEVPPHAR